MVITPALTTGISDFYFKNTKKDKRNVPPLWMNEKEKAEWKHGQRIAKKALWEK